MYSGATDHVTGELEMLTVHDKYGGHDQVHSASGAGMKIQHVGSSKLCSYTSTFHLNTILHVPQASKSLVSVNHLTRDNNVFLEFYPDHFSMKEWGMRRTLLKGRCEGGLYPLKPTQNKKALAVIKPSTFLCHSRLGHASTPVVQQALNRHKLPFVLDSNKNAICDAC
jgi:hypothetical protein